MGGAAWEVSLADVQRARLPGTPTAQRAALEHPALEHLARLHIDVDVVLPPMEMPAPA
jgi:hypothetical protein